MAADIRAKPASRRLSFENRVLILALATGLPGIGVASWLLWTAQFTAQTKWTLAAMLIVLWLGCVQALRHKIRYPLQTLSNILAGFREGDFSTRLRGAKRGDALGEVLAEVNTLGKTLHEQRRRIHRLLLPHSLSRLLPSVKGMQGARG